MKNVFVLFITIGMFLSCASTETNKTKGSHRQVSKENLEFIKSKFQFNKEDLLIISGISPDARCHHNNLNTSKIMMLDFINRVNISNAKRVIVILEKFKRNGIIDDEIVFNDPNNEMQQLLFSSLNNCTAVVVLNKNGDFLIKNGEIAEKDIRIMANKLNLKQNNASRL